MPCSGLLFGGPRRVRAAVHLAGRREHPRPNRELDIVHLLEAGPSRDRDAALSMLKISRSPVLTSTVEHAQALICACSTSNSLSMHNHLRVDSSIPCLSRREGVTVMTEDESQAAAEDLAKRLRLLMDVAVAESGTEPTYSQIAGYLQERGTNLSRSRWTYMVSVHRPSKTPPSSEGARGVFDVDAAFPARRGRVSLPRRSLRSSDLVRSMRAAKVKSYAARLGAISRRKPSTPSCQVLDEE